MWHLFVDTSGTYVEGFYRDVGLMLELLLMFLLELFKRLGSDMLLAKELLLRVLLTGGIRWEKFLG